MRTMAQGASRAAEIKAALRIAIRLLTDEELAHEAEVMKRRAREAQSMAAKLSKEIKRRKRGERNARR